MTTRRALQPKITVFLLLLSLLLCGLFGMALADDKLSCPIEVVWDDQDNLYNLRPSSMSIYFVREDTGETISVSLSESKDYRSSVSLLLFDTNTGKPVQWNVELSPYENYQFKLTETSFDPATRTFRPVIQHTKTAPIVARVRFSDMDNALGNRPTAEAFAPTLTITPSYNNGTGSYTSSPASSVVDNGDGSYTVTWDDIPTAFDTFDGDPDTASIRDTQFKVSINPNTDGYAKATFGTVPHTQNPQTVTVPMTSSKYYIRVRVTLDNTLYDNPYLSDQWHDLPDMANFVLRNYNGNTTYFSTPVQLTQDGRYATGELLLEYDEAPSFFTKSLYPAISNLSTNWSCSTQKSTSGSLLDFNITLTPKKRTLTASTTINDQKDAQGFRGSPLEVIHHITADGVDVQIPVKVSGTYNTYSASMPSTVHFPAYSPDGKPLEYSITAEGLPGYYKINEEGTYVSSPEFNSFYLYAYSVYDLPTRPVTATVIWDDARDNGKSRPESVQITLLSDGEPILSQIVSETTGWKAVFDAPVYNENGEIADYSIKQSVLPIHTVTITENDPVDGNDPVTEDGKPETAIDDALSFTVTNTLQEDWNYYVDLVWDTTIAAERYDRYEISQTSNDTRTLVYKLTINVNAAKYEAGDLEVRLPYAHISTNRLAEKNVAPVPPKAIAVPKAPSYNINNAFNYYIDDKGTPKDISDDELVFVNWRDIEDSLNQTIEVEYQYYPPYLVDTMRYEWQAVGSGVKYEVIDGERVKAAQPEIQLSPVITYGVDTGTQTPDWVLTAKQLSESTHSSWVSKLKNAGLYDPENYFYVYATYEIDSSIIFNQHGVATVELTAPDGGEIMPFQDDEIHMGGSWSHSVVANTNIDPETNTIRTTHAFEASTSTSSYSRPLDGGVHYVIRYPRTPEGDAAGEYDVHLEAKASFICNNEHENDKVDGLDYNDVTQDADELDYIWEPLPQWDYTGKLWDTDKNGTSITSYPVSRLELGMNLSNTYTVEGEFYGYEEEWRPFQIDLRDDALFVQGKVDDVIGEPIRLVAGDYEMALKYVWFQWSDYDSNGIRNINNAPFGTYLLQAQTAPDGPWQDVFTFEIGEEDKFHAGASNASKTFDAALFQGKGYTGLRVISPEGQRGMVMMNMCVSVTYFADAPVFKELLAQGMTYLYITNWCDIRYNVANEEGVYEWVNPYEYCNYSGPGDAQLAAADSAAEGGLYPRRDLYTTSGGKVTKSSNVDKTIASTINNTTDGTVDVRFKLQGYETLGSADFTEMTQDLSWQYGVFYDLLPLGYTFDADMPVNVYSASGGDSSSYPKCSLVKTEVIDNYQNTGRQMIRFYVQHDGELGKNGYVYYSGNQYRTGFTVYFWARAPWEQLSIFPYGYNVMGLQEGSLDEATGEIVYGGEQNDIASGRVDNGSMFTVTHGANVQEAMSDLNGDGNPSDVKDTLTDSVYLNPDFISAYQVGLAKFVKANSGIWQSHDVADLGGEYRWKIRLTLGSGGTTRDLVLFDVLEDAANTEAHTGEIFWKGKFRDVDVSIPILQGIAPKVYYSTVQGLDSNNFTGKADLTNEAVWSPTPPGNLDDVTALAFDLSTSAAGDDFVFNKAITTEVQIIMEAPEELPEADLAYNRSSYASTYAASTSAQATSSHNIGHRVTVALHETKDFRLTKLGEMEDAEPAGLAGAEFTLYRCTHTHHNCQPNCHTHHGVPGESDSCWTAGATTQVSAQDGTVCFEDLDYGLYALVETSTAPGHILPEDAYWTFEVDASTNGGILNMTNAGNAENHPSITGNEEDGFELVNFRQKTSLNVAKTWAGEDADLSLRPAQILLDLYRNDTLYRNDVEVTPDADGNWQYTFDSLMATDPQGQPYRYRVQEEHVPGYVCSATTNGNTVSLTNTCPGQLEIGKLVVDGDQTKAFTFVVAFTGSGTPLQGDYDVRRTAVDGTVSMETVTAAADGSLTVSAAHGETVRLLGLPIGANYSVTEAPAGGYTSAVTSGSSEGVIQSATVHQVVFTNTYHATGELKLTAQKTVNGSVPTSDEIFAFELTNAEGTPDLYQNKNNLDGVVTFDPILYTLADVGKTFVYTISETTEAGDGYTPDAAVYTVSVTLRDNGDGTLTATPTYLRDGTPANSVTFDNRYEASGLLPLTAQKTVNGMTPREDQVFAFALESAEGTPVTVQQKNNSGSTVTFDPILYTLADVGKTYVYTVSETTAATGGYTPYEQVFTVTVTPTDNRDGSLTIVPVITVNGTVVETIAFDNRYEATGSLTIAAQKTVNDQEPRADQVYAFRLESTGDTPALVRETVNNGSAIVFEPIHYTLADAGKTYTYRIIETSDATDALVPDATVYNVTVQIEDQRDGTLKVTPTYSADGTTAEGVLFHNTLYAPLTIGKTVSGPETDETFPITVSLYDAQGNESTGIYTYTGDLEGSLSSGDSIRLGHGQSITIRELLPGMRYTVEETPGVRYTGTVDQMPCTVVEGVCEEGGNSVHFTNVLKTTEISVTKVWDGDNGGDIKLNLYANGVLVDPQPVYHRDGDTYTYQNLPMYDGIGSKILYSVMESYMDGYVTVYQNTAPYKDETGCVYDGGVITNRSVVTFRIRKIWKGLAEDETPPAIQLTLYCNGTVYKHVQPKPDEDGWYVYRNLPKYVNGQIACYTVIEEPLDGYETSYLNSNGNVAKEGVHMGKIINYKLPNTADHAPLALWITLIAAASLFLCLLLKRRRCR